MFDSLAGQAAWIWIAAGVLFCAGEIFAPGVFLLFLGIAAIATGFVIAIFPLSFIWSLIVFGVLSIIAVLIGQKFYGSRDTSSDQPFLNRRAEALVGKTFVLADPIRAGEGAIRVNDTKWRVRGPDMPAGARVRVVRVEDATVLVVEQL